MNRFTKSFEEISLIWTLAGVLAMFFLILASIISRRNKIIPLD